MHFPRKVFSTFTTANLSKFPSLSEEKNPYYQLNPKGKHTFEANSVHHESCPHQVPYSLAAECFLNVNL